MTLIVPIFDSIGTGTRISLTGTDELYLPPGVTIFSTDLTVTVNAVGAANKITIFGNVSSGATAIQIGSGAVLDTVRIEASGVVKGSYGLRCEGSSDVVNDGMILASTFGVALRVADGLTHKVVNTGLIASAYLGISYSSAIATGSSHSSIVNTGTVKAVYAVWLYNQFASHSFDVTNRGTLDGEVGLNASNDLLDNFGGTITGLIQMFQGDDTLVASTSAETAIGGDGTDLLDLGGLGGAVLYLDGVTANGGSTAGDHFTEFEKVIGSVLGSDRIVGAAADESFDGKGGNDQLSGMAGNDTLIGGAGNDVMSGGIGNDVMTGGAGNDVFYVDSAADQVIETVAGGRDGVRSSVSLTLAANVEDGFIVAAVGRSLSGNGLGNHLTGGAGGDVLNGRVGVDFLRGGAGADRFVFMSASEDGDQILDFSHGQDHISLRALGYGGGLLAGHAIAAGAFITRADNVAQQADDHFIFRTSDATLWFDANGNAAGGLTMVADLQAGAVVTAADILVI